MLQITEQNISLKLGLSKKTRALLTTEKEWASPMRQNSHSPPLWKLGQRIKIFYQN